MAIVADHVQGDLAEKAVLLDPRPLTENPMTRPKNHVYGVISIVLTAAGIWASYNALKAFHIIPSTATLAAQPLSGLSDAPPINATPVPEETPEADTAAVSAQIKAELEKKFLSVGDVNLVRDSERTMRGNVDVRVSWNEAYSETCTVTFDLNGRDYVWECKPN